MMDSISGVDVVLLTLLISNVGRILGVLRAHTAKENNLKWKSKMVAEQDL
jgi:hypothetical protein